MSLKRVKLLLQFVERRMAAAKLAGSGTPVSLASSNMDRPRSGNERESPDGPDVPFYTGFLHWRSLLSAFRINVG